MDKAKQFFKLSIFFNDLIGFDANDLFNSQNKKIIVIFLIKMSLRQPLTATASTQVK